MKLTDSKDDTEYYVCGGCLGHQWVVIEVERPNGQKNVAVKSCPSCNPKGELGVGFTVSDHSGADWSGYVRVWRMSEAKRLAGQVRYFLTGTVGKERLEFIAALTKNVCPKCGSWRYEDPCLSCGAPPLCVDRDFRNRKGRSGEVR
jgi:hypothetical protein